MHYETKSILDKIKGSIILATEEGEQEYVNIDAIPENLLDAEMIVSAIEARDSKIVPVSYTHLTLPTTPYV